MINKKKIFPIFFLIIISSFWVIYFFNRDFFELKTLFIYLETIQNYISNNFLFSFLIFTFSYCFLIVCNFPIASLLSLIGGFLYGTWIGGIGIIIGGTIGSFIVFLVAKSFFHDYITKKLLHKYPFINQYFQKNELELMFLIRLIPGIPFFAQNLILAGLGGKRVKFLFTTLLGLSPWAMIFASIGQGLEVIFIEGQALSFALIAKPEYLIPLSLIIVLVVFILIFKKKFK
ncbi:MAG: TVP38/TMEM64 family protein [Alphaproteobacteria bacterium]